MIHSKSLAVIFSISNPAADICPYVGEKRR